MLQQDFLQADEDDEMYSETENGRDGCRSPSMLENYSEYYGSYMDEDIEMEEAPELLSSSSFSHKEHPQESGIAEQSPPECFTSASDASSSPDTAFEVVGEELAEAFETLNEESQDLESQYPESQEDSQDSQDSQSVLGVVPEEGTSLVDRIENLVLEMVDAIGQRELPCFEVVLEDAEGNLRNKKVDFAKDSSRNKFTVMISILARAHRLLLDSRTMTKRDLYYENVNLYRNMGQVNLAIQELAVFLEVFPSAFPFVPSAKGLMAAGGKLVLTRDDDENDGVVTVPLEETGSLIQGFRVMRNWGRFRSNAQFVLIVEKDAIFYRLTEEGIFEQFEPFILVTGKGYPDRATRAFVSKLSRDLRIPSFVLVDADPYGLEIASIYKRGSMAQQKFPEENISMVIPDLNLIGVLPSELLRLNFPGQCRIPLQPRDYQKLDALIARLRSYNDQSWAEEAETLKKLGFKAEIEAVASLGFDYLCKEYLYKKILPRTQAVVKNSWQ